jgi:hypothetical protein
VGTTLSVVYNHHFLAPVFMQGVLWGIGLLSSELDHERNQVRHEHLLRMQRAVAILPACYHLADVASDSRRDGGQRAVRRLAVVHDRQAAAVQSELPVLGGARRLELKIKHEFKLFRVSESRSDTLWCL